MTKTVNLKCQLGFINQKVINSFSLESLFCFSIQHEPAIDSLLPLTGNPQIILSATEQLNYMTASHLIRSYYRRGVSLLLPAFL